MQAELESIRTGYETLKLTPEQIAEDRNLTVEAVKAALLNCSSAYRRDAKAEPKDDSRLNFSDDQLVHINEEIFRLAIYAEDENVRTKNCHYLRDDKKNNYYQLHLQFEFLLCLLLWHIPNNLKLVSVLSNKQYLL